MAHYGSIDIQKGLLAASLINIVVLVATFTLQIIPNFIDISKPIDDYYGKVVNHKFWLKIRQNKSAANWTAVPCGILTYLWVSFCWVFFRNENITNAFSILKRIFFWSNDGIRQIFSWLIVAIIFMLLMMLHAWKHAKGKLLEEHYIILDLSKTIPLFIWFVVLGAILGTAYTGDNPFIYFQF